MSLFSRLRASFLRMRWLLLLFIGVTIQAFAYATFQVPFNLAAGGIGGLSLVVNHFTGLPVGVTYFVLNIPLFVLGFYNLGRWNFLGKTLLAVTLFSVLVDLFVWLLPQVIEPYPVSQIVLLNALYGAILGGVGGGLVYRSGASAGGTSILGRVVQVRTGIPLSQVFLVTDGAIVILMGIVFGWETSLYALLMLFLWGMAADYVLEGPSSVRTVTIVTQRPDEVTIALRERLGRTVTLWPVTGGFSGDTLQMLLCTVQRPQVSQLRQVILAADPEAFFVVGDAHHAVGGDFASAARREA
jgi:uncharacterized membrane-anchored protein YitT (DUF2179 family)